MKLQDWFSLRALGLGREYLEEGRLKQMRRKGDRLEASVEGSRDRLYKVWLRLGGERIADGKCSCPVGEGGDCKHAAALALAWVEEPEAFLEADRAEKELEKLSKPELVGLIRRMLEQCPELSVLLETRAPALDTAKLRARAERAANSLQRYKPELGLMETLIEEGQTFMEARDYPRAAQYWVTLLQAWLPYAEQFNQYDENGETLGFLQEAVEAAGEVFSEVQDSSLRAELVEVLWRAYLADLEIGGVDLAYAVPEQIAAWATPEERARVMEWARAQMARTQGFVRQELGGLILKLSDKLDNEGYLELCRQSGRSEDLVSRLLELGRVEEARTEAEQASVGKPGLRDHFLQLFIEHGFGSQARAMAEGMLRKHKDHSLQRWLCNYLQQEGDWDEALWLAEEMFWASPTLEGYLELAKLSGKLGRWSERQPLVLKGLEEKGAWLRLVEIHLHEGRPEEALLAYRKAGETRSTFWSGWLRVSLDELGLKVAQALEDTHPQEALDIYRQQAERLIEYRSRDAYREASRLFKKVRALYQKQGQKAEWLAYVSKLKQTHARLRALQEELSRAGL